MLGDLTRFAFCVLSGCCLLSLAAFTAPAQPVMLTVFAGPAGGVGPVTGTGSTASLDIHSLLDTGVISTNCATFAGSGNFGAGLNPYSVAVGDLNGDGKLDLAVANNGDGVTPSYVSTLRGNGGGKFGFPVNFNTAIQPWSVAIGDLNGDGNADLAVSNNSDATVSILLGYGNGVFAPKVNYLAGFFPRTVAIGDLNGDGKADLAVANSLPGTVSILLGQGNGTFAAKVPYGAGSFPESVTTGDFNGDGTRDLAVANSGSGNVSILLGNGDGTFAGAVNYTAGTTPFSVAVGDFNGDGTRDLAVANSGSGNVSILLGNGNGTFAAKVDYSTATQPASVAIADFDGDGNTDLAVANYYSDSVSILFGNGNGTFAAAVDYAVRTGPWSVATGDFTGDGRPDLAVANRQSNNVSTLLNTCPLADLTIFKEHFGDFKQGDTYRLYMIAVKNVGTAPTTGTVTVNDTLPAGLAAMDISGEGWTCDSVTLNCTRSDTLAASPSYPLITLGVSVNSDAAPRVTNMATVSGGGETNLANDTVSDSTTITPINPAPRRRAVRH